LSNTVIWQLLASQILRAVDTLVNDPVESASLEKERERHPLVMYIEKELKQVFRPEGGIDCPELEALITDMMNCSPEKLNQLINLLVKKYYKFKGKSQDIGRYFTPIRERESGLTKIRFYNVTL